MAQKLSFGITGRQWGNNRQPQTEQLTFPSATQHASRVGYRLVDGPNTVPHPVINQPSTPAAATQSETNACTQIPAYGPIIFILVCGRGEQPYRCHRDSRPDINEHR